MMSLHSLKAILKNLYKFAVYYQGQTHDALGFHDISTPVAVYVS